MNAYRSANAEQQHVLRPSRQIMQIIFLLAIAAAGIALADDPKLDTPPQKEADRKSVV